MKKKRLGLLNKREKNLMTWASYWRQNPHKFVEDYLGISLFLYQKILIYMIERVPTFMYIASRGQGKSFLIALYCIVRCILYPNTNIVLASGVKKQAQLIITEKIAFFYNNYEGVRAEIGDRRNIKGGANDTSVTFLNGSKIVAIASNDNARGYRGNILVLDEFRLIKKEIIDLVLSPMLNVVRRPEFMNKPEYKDYPQEQNKSVYISSAWFKTHWIWDEFNQSFKNMIGDGSAFVSAIPYQLSIMHRLLPAEKAKKDREEYSKTDFDMEYEALFVGENEKGFFKLDDINKCMTITKAFIPPTSLEYIENMARSVPKKISNIPRIDTKDEIRLVALDVALLSGNSKNDTSAFTCMRLVREGEKYRRDVLYLETVRESISTENLAIRLKQLYNDFEADYVVVDTNGIGIGVFDSLTSILFDEERDEEYAPWSAVNDEEMNDRVKAKGLPVIYSIKGNSKLNSDIATSLRTSFEKLKLRLPIRDIEKREELVNKGGFLKESIQEQTRQLYPFVQSSALSNELVSLEYDIRAGNISIKEVGSATKDRYSSLAYCNYIADEFEKELRTENNSDPYSDYIFISSYT